MPPPTVNYREESGVSIMRNTNYIYAAGASDTESTAMRAFLNRNKIPPIVPEGTEIYSRNVIFDKLQQTDDPSKIQALFNMLRTKQFQREGVLDRS